MLVQYDAYSTFWLNRNTYEKETIEDYFNYAVGSFAICWGESREAAGGEGVQRSAGIL